jgi:hypothetical protein
MNNIMPGDLVKCIKISNPAYALPIHIGNIYLVTEIGMGWPGSTCGEVPIIKLDNIHPFEIPNTNKIIIGHRMSDFVKINPDSEKKATKVWDWNKEPVNV